MWGVVVGAGGSEPGAAEHNTHFCKETWLFFYKGSYRLFNCGL